MFMATACERLLWKCLSFGVFVVSLACNRFQPKIPDAWTFLGLLLGDMGPCYLWISFCHLGLGINMHPWTLIEHLPNIYSASSPRPRPSRALLQKRLEPGLSTPSTVLSHRVRILSENFSTYSMCLKYDDSSRQDAQRLERLREHNKNTHSS